MKVHKKNEMMRILRNRQHGIEKSKKKHLHIRGINHITDSDTNNFSSNNNGT